MMRYRDYPSVSMRFGAAEISQVRGTRTMNRAACLCAGLLAVMALSGCDHKEARLVLTKPVRRDTVVTRVYVCQIHSCRREEIRAKTRGHLKVVNARAGRLVKEGDEMFEILPQAPGSAAKRPEAEITRIRAPFNGRTDRLHKQGGSTVMEGDLLTMLSDNSEMWVDFNVPEAQYPEYSTTEPKEAQLILANGRMFDQTGRVSPIKAGVNPKTGSIPFRAVFPNPKDLLRHGLQGNIRMQNTIKQALLVPRKSTFEFMEHHCIYVVGKDHVIRRKQLSITQELEDFFTVADGVSENDMILFEGMQQVRDGEKAGDFKYEEPAEAYAHLKFTAR